MSWEQRGNRTYYYTAHRVGGKVVKEYVPPRVAEAAALIDAERRVLRKADAADLAALDAALAPLDDLADVLARATFLAAGFHRHHRGPWRKRCAY